MWKSPISHLSFINQAGLIRCHYQPCALAKFHITISTIGSFRHTHTHTRAHLVSVHILRVFLIPTVKCVAYQKCKYFLINLYIFFLLPPLTPLPCLLCSFVALSFDVRSDFLFLYFLYDSTGRPEVFFLIFLFNIY